MSQVTSDTNGQGIILYAKINRKGRIKFFQLKFRFIFRKDLVWIFVNCNRMRLNFWSDTSKLFDRKLLYSTRKNKQNIWNKTRNRIWKLDTSSSSNSSFSKGSKWHFISHKILLHNFASIEYSFILEK